MRRAVAQQVREDRLDRRGSVRDREPQAVRLGELQRALREPRCNDPVALAVGRGGGHRERLDERQRGQFRADAIDEAFGALTGGRCVAGRQRRERHRDLELGPARRGRGGDLLLQRRQQPDPGRVGQRGTARRKLPSGHRHVERIERPARGAEIAARNDSRAGQ